MISIDARTIPHAEQRYETVGDWYKAADGTKVFRVSNLPNKSFEFLVLIHELIEEHLCELRGVTAGDVDKFDTQYERDRPPGDTSEPGDDPISPYYREHQFATAIERLVAVEIGVDWEEYNRAIEGL